MAASSSNQRYAFHILQFCSRKMFCWLLLSMIESGGSEFVRVPNSLEDSAAFPMAEQSMRGMEQYNNENNENNETNLCSAVCGGLTLSAEDKYGENTTCADMDSYVQQLSSFDLAMPVHVGSETYYYPYSCRANQTVNKIFETCCKASIPVYECEQNVHDVILGDRKTNNYNSAVPPITNFDEGVNVEVFLQYDGIDEIAEEEGTASLHITLILRWRDPRLAWSIEDFDTCANVIETYTGFDQETTQIWVPDLDLLNRVEGLHSFDDAKATIFSDGTVHWERRGGMTALCSFTGLGSIPFDILGCQLLFASGTRGWSENINYIIPVPELMYFGPFDVAYNEWQPIPEKATQGYTNGNDLIFYNFYFRRAHSQYLQNIVIPTILLTYLSFLTFLLDMRVGERLGFGMALALVVVAQQIVTSDMTPISDQKLWLDKFVAWSFYWVLIGVIESVVVGFLYFIREDHEAGNDDSTVEATKSISRRTSQERDGEGTHQLVDTSDMNEGGNIRDAMEEDSSDNARLGGNQTNRLSEQNVENRAKTDSSAKCMSANFWNDLIYKYPLRKMDFNCLFAAVVGYSVFVMFMFLSKSSRIWLANEPQWFDPTTTSFETVYVNDDPNK